MSGLHDGAKNWFETSTPFDPSRFATTSGLVDLCFFALMAVFAWLLIDGRFALAALACAFALYAIPSTAVGMGSAGLRAAIFLLLALAILAVCQRRVPLGGGAIGQLSVLAVATVVAGLVVGSAPGVAKGALFDWRHWNPLAGNGPQVSVGYVWNQDYGPLHWPKQTTTVFQVQSAHPHYWKAGVLTVFDGTHWVSSPATQASYHATDAIGIPTSQETSKELHPDSPSDITQVGFTVEALADFRLLSTGQPLRYTLTSPIDAQPHHRRQRVRERRPAPRRHLHREGLLAQPQAEAAGRGRKRVPVVCRAVGDREPRDDSRVGQRHEAADAGADRQPAGRGQQSGLACVRGG